MHWGKVTDKLLFTALYLLASLLVVWGARFVANYALDVRFYQDFLLPWEAGLVALRYQVPSRPPYRKEDPLASMQALVSHMQAHGVAYPSSNTQHPFVYDLSKFGERAQKILMVYENGRMTLYGLPAATFDRLDGLIDGRRDPDRGDFTGRWSVDLVSRIAHWKI